MRLSLLMLTLLLLVLQPQVQAQAQQATTLKPIVVQASPTTQTLDISQILSSVGAKEGFMYNIGQRRGTNFVATTLISRNNFSLDGGLVGTDGLGIALDYDLNGLSDKFNIPILKFADYINIGFGVSYRRITLTGDLAENPKTDNSFGYGPVIFLKWKF